MDRQHLTWNSEVDELKKISYTPELSKARSGKRTEYFLVFTILLAFIYQTVLLSWTCIEVWDLKAKENKESVGVPQVILVLTCLLLDLNVIFVVICQGFKQKYRLGVSHAQLTYLISNGIKLYYLGSNEQFEYRINNDIGPSLLSGIRLLSWSPLLVWLLGYLQWWQNYYRDIYDNIAEASISYMVIIKVSSDLFDASFLYNCLYTELQRKYELSILYVMLSTFIFHSFSGFADTKMLRNYKGLQDSEWITTAKYSALVSLWLVDLGGLIIRLSVIIKQYRTQNTFTLLQFKNLTFIIKNVIGIPHSLMLMHQIRLVEMDEDKQVYRYYKGNEVLDNNMEEQENEVPNEIGTPVVAPFDQVLSEEEQSVEPIPFEANTNDKNNAIKSILKSFPNAKEGSIKKVVDELSFLRGLKLEKNLSNRASFTDFFKLLFSSYQSHVQLYSSIRVVAHKGRQILLAFASVLGLIQPLLIIIIELYSFWNDAPCEVKCRYSNEAGTLPGLPLCHEDNICLALNYDYWNQESVQWIDDIERMFCTHYSHCRTQLISILVINFLAFILLVVNTPFVTSFLFFIYRCITSYSFWLLIRGIRWSGYFDKTIVFLSPGKSDLSIHLEIPGLFILSLWSNIDLIRTIVYTFLKVMGLSKINLTNPIKKKLYRHDFLPCIAEGQPCRPRTVEEAKRTTTMINENEFLYSDIILIIISIGLKNSTLPFSFNEFLIGPDILSSVRVADAMQTQEWVRFTIKFCFKLVILCAIGSAWYTIVFGITILCDFIYILFANSIRLMCLKRYEVKAIFASAVEFAQSLVVATESTVDDRSIVSKIQDFQDASEITLLSNVLRQIREEGTFTDHATTYPLGFM